MLALEQTGTDRHFAELSETKAESSDTATRWGTSNSRTYLLPDKTYRLVSSLINAMTELFLTSIVSSLLRTPQTSQKQTEFRWPRAFPTRSHGSFTCLCRDPFPHLQAAFQPGLTLEGTWEALWVIREDLRASSNSSCHPPACC